MYKTDRWAGFFGASNVLGGGTLAAILGSVLPVDQVKAAIIDGLANGAVTEKSVAAEMYTTPRNLHRKLHKEDTSFKQLLTEVRQDLAQQYIQDRSKTLTEISYLLGFSEVSSFSRAFKGWTGMPPSAAREDVA